MKTFENKGTELTYNEGGKADGTKIKMGFADLAISCLQNAPKDGWDKNSLKKSFKIDSIFKRKEVIKDVLFISELKIGAKVELEDADFDYLYERAQPENMKWSAKHIDILSFLEYLDKLKKD